MAGFNRLHRARRPLQRGLRQFRRVGVASRFANNGAQAKALLDVEARRFQAIVVKKERLGLGVFEIKFAVVGVFQRLADNRFGSGLVEVGAAEEK